MPDNERLNAERSRILAAEARGFFPSLATYFKLTGPGVATSALSLGAGSMGSSLYLGVLAGVSMLWIQPFAMLLGVIMLSAISYVTLSLGERPFRAINEHINPVLGWSWLAAAMAANIIWSMPQYSLSFAVIEQNLLPSLFQGNSWFGAGTNGGGGGKYVVSTLIAVLCIAVAWSFGGGNRGAKVFDLLMKIVVAGIMLSFFGVVLRISFTGDGIDWLAVFRGLIPNWRQLSEPSATFAPLLTEIQNPEARRFWTDLIVSQQRDVMLGAGSAAVGINMTYMLPYLMLSRGWDRDFRRLAIFDLLVGMFLPFAIATAFVVIAAAHQFHTIPPTGFEITGASVAVPLRFQKEFDRMIAERARVLPPTIAPEPAEHRLAAVLVRRDTLDLAQSLSQLFGGNEPGGGRFMSNVVFGVGVLGMTLSSIALMMLISGLIVCEVFNAPLRGLTFRLGCLPPVVGALWPIFWQDSVRAWLTVAASVSCITLLPIAYVSFFALVNQKSLMGEDRPTGGRRWIANLLMGFATLCAAAAAISAVVKNAGLPGLAIVAAYVALLLVVQLLRARRPT